MGMANLGVSHFQYLFKAPAQTSIGEVVKVALFFLRFVDESDNRTLLKECSQEEVKDVLHSLGGDKSPGPDGWTVEFLLGLFDIIGGDILKVVEDSRST